MPNRRWIWYFAVLLVLAVIAVAAPLIVNLRQQLKPEDVARWKALWRERAPRDYDLEITERIDIHTRTDEFEVEVRGGKVVASRWNKQPTDGPVLTIDTIFHHIEANLAVDQSSDSRNFTTA